MAAKKDDKEKSLDGQLDAASAIMAAFDAYKQVRCVSIEKGGRVENVLSTGSLILDLILGGGFQRGRIADIFGPEGSGKTTLLQEGVVSAQSEGIPSVIYDFEHSMDPTYMKAMGVDLDYAVRIGKRKLPGFHYVQPDAGEDVYRHMLKTLESIVPINPEKPGKPVVHFVLDSFAAMYSEKEDPETDGKGGLGLDARMHSLYLRRLRNRLRKAGGLFVMSNQLRANIDLKNRNAPKEKEPGGNALRFYADYKVRVSSSRGAIEDTIGVAQQKIYLRTIKNKSFPPFQTAECMLMLGRGVDKAVDALEFLKAIGKYKTHGSFRRILLKRFDTGKGMSWKKFREITESAEFRDFCFRALQTQEGVYAQYFKQRNYKNYVYDRETKSEIAADA